MKSHGKNETGGHRPIFALAAFLTPALIRLHETPSCYRSDGETLAQLSFMP